MVKPKAIDVNTLYMLFIIIALITVGGITYYAETEIHIQINMTQNTTLIYSPNITILDAPNLKNLTDRVSIIEHRLDRINTLYDEVMADARLG